MAIVSDDIKARVQQATDLVRLIGEHVALRPRGREFIGLCPFHDDKNPSMYVSPAKQIYKCFSCGAGGDAFSFMMDYHKMTFPEALKHLAERAGIALPDKTSHESHHPGDPATNRAALLEANARASGFFQALFRHSEHGRVPRDYIAARHIIPAMVDAFQIGYAPDRWDGLVLTIAEKQWPLAAFEKLGLVSRRTTGEGYYDRFRHRLIFPICDSLGRVIALGGRKLREEDEPKYLNSPESVLFNKSATLYGLHLAKKSIIQQHTAVVVEGYTDVIACHQHGASNVVATLGTALTAQHVVELRRYCDKVILIYDGDEAGIKAADRALEIFLTGGLDVAIAIIPDGRDPGDLFALPDGLARWQKVIEASVDALTFQFERMRTQLQAVDTVTGRQKLVEEYLRLLAQIGLGRSKGLAIFDRSHQAQGGGTIRRNMILQKIGQLLRTDEATVNRLLSQFAPVTRPTSPSITPESARNNSQSLENTSDLSRGVALGESEASIKALRVAEQQVIGCLLIQPDLFQQTVLEGRPMDEALVPAEMPTPLGQAIYQRIYDTLSQGRPLALVGLLADIAEAGQSELVAPVTDAVSLVEAACGDQVERIKQLLTESAQAIIAFHKQQEYRRLRNQIDNPFTPQAETSMDTPDTGWHGNDALRRMHEHLQTPSMRRMPRVRKN